jgi:hypothetical protein
MEQGVKHVALRINDLLSFGQGNGCGHKKTRKPFGLAGFLNF